MLTKTFDPGEVIFVFTGPGRDRYVATPTGGRRPQFQFHWGRRDLAWDRPARRYAQVYRQAKLTKH